jgi:8-oxo-dGTP diphosphatase
MLLATLCYVKRDGYTLMLYRNRKANDIHEGKWNGLGGKFDAGETPEECVIREVYEESGCPSVTRNYAACSCSPNSKAQTGTSLSLPQTNLLVN